MSEIKSGIYKITNSVNGKFYIGSAVHIKNRWSNHKTHLNKGTHKNPHLQAAWNLYGGDAFTFTVIEYVEHREELTVREQHWLDAEKACEVGYNILPIAASGIGFKHTEEAKAKISKAMKGRKCKPFTKEHRDNMGGAWRGKKRSEESRARMSEAQKRRTHKPLSEEHKRKISEGMKKARSKEKELENEAI